MTKKCDLTGKKSMTGNNVSHANNKTKRKFYPNLQSVSLYSENLETKLSFKIAASTLVKGGRLLMVANRNLPYEQTLKDNFRSFEKLVEREGFKVFEAVCYQ